MGGRGPVFTGARRHRDARHPPSRFQSREATQSVPGDTPRPGDLPAYVPLYLLHKQRGGGGVGNAGPSLSTAAAAAADNRVIGRTVPVCHRAPLLGCPSKSRVAGAPLPPTLSWRRARGSRGMMAGNEPARERFSRRKHLEWPGTSCTTSRHIFWKSRPPSCDTSHRPRTQPRDIS